MIDRFIFEASRVAPTVCVDRSELVGPVDRVGFEGLELISSIPVLRWCWIGEQLRNPQQAVAADREGRHERNARQSAHPHLAQRPPVLAPAKDFFDPLAQALAGQVAAMARRAPIDRRAARTLQRLSDMRRHTQLATAGDEASGVIQLVPGYRSAGAPWRLSIRSAVSRSANPFASVISTSTGSP